MSTKPKILVIRDPQSQIPANLPELGKDFELEQVSSPFRGLAKLARTQYAGVFVAGNLLARVERVGKLLQNERILEGMPDGVLLLDADNTIIWANERIKEWCQREHLSGQNFYTVMGSPEILGPDFCPFHTALSTGKASGSTLKVGDASRVGDNRYYHLHAMPVLEGQEAPRHLIVTVRDVTPEMLQQQKLATIHEAGEKLADMTPDELSLMTVEERIEYLKNNILQYTKDLLHFDVVEIRLLDAKTGLLMPLLAVGMSPEAEKRVLRADLEDNGVTGYVAASGKTYLCDDTHGDKKYLEGCKGAKSSLTVPLILHETVIGTFNVESPEPRAFTESDRQFLEIFTRDVAQAINTLFLLEAEKANTCVESVEAIHSAVALPIDEILNEAVNVMQRYIGHEPEVVERLENILRNARDIKQVIQKVGQKMAPSQALPANKQVDKRPLLRGKQVLVADADATVRNAAHALLERYGCIVETAHDGHETICMVQNKLTMEGGYDVIISDIRLPDMNGYELLKKLKEMVDPVPMVMMLGYGYDSTHTITKSREEGLLPSYAALAKPFRLDQLLTVTEKVISSRKPTPTPTL
ncbi:MAG: response regulator [Pirellulales bacterium]|nr:response regulator [Pirellulales bacterium]